MPTKKILITGATGKQGSAVIDAILSLDTTPFTILALTRNAKSAKAQSLAANPYITVVEGDLTSLASIFEAHKPIHGVFLYTIPSKEGDEERQAKPIIDASITSSVSHLIFSSVDRGGPDVSPKNPTSLPHFASKYRIEAYLRAQIQSTNSAMKYTILRPVAFMENLSPSFFGKAFASAWASMGDKKPLQLISVRDIGVFTARAFADQRGYAGREITLAGDELTFEQGKEVFKRTLETDIPETWRFVGWLLRRIVGEVGMMFTWFETVGFGGDVKALREEEPRLQDLGKWLKESSAWAKK